jgi:hypothetical protein
MRSFTLRAALAAVLVSTSLAGAHAAALPAAPGTPLPSAAAQAQPVKPDAMTTGAITAPKSAHVAMQREVFRPRLAHIDYALGAANHRIRVDHGRGYLTAAEYRMLRARSHDIRMDAQRTASNHRGALPRASYVAYLNRVESLNHAIHRAATT